MKQNFNDLTLAQEERLHLLAEEAAEVSQAAMKILRHGFESYNPKKNKPKSNRMELEKELGDFLNALGMLREAGDINYSSVINFEQIKRDNIKQWLHHN